MIAWPVEEIPDEECLFYRVPVGRLRPNLRLHPGNFEENKGSMSTDWEKYSTASETRARQGRPERFGVLRLVAGNIRQIDGMTVVHTPVQDLPDQIDNRAHTSVFGIQTNPSSTNPDLARKLRIRTELYNRFKTWEIAPDAPVG